MDSSSEVAESVIVILPGVGRLSIYLVLLVLIELFLTRILLMILAVIYPLSLKLTVMATPTDRGHGEYTNLCQIGRPYMAWRVAEGPVTST